MINLLSLEEKKEIRKDYHRRVHSVCLPLSAFVFFIAVLTLLPSYFMSLRAYEKILKESKSEEVVNKQSQEAEMRSLVTDANKKILLLKKVESKNGAWDIFNKILSMRPDGVTITGFSYEYRIPTANAKAQETVKAISIQGVSKSRETIQTFTNTVKKDRNFKSVDLPISSLISDSDFSYNINIVANE
jgi:hypothetical protein